MITASADTIMAALLVAGSIGFLAGWSMGALRAETKAFGRLVEAERARYRAMFGEDG